jgi:hypothetical protein
MISSVRLCTASWSRALPRGVMGWPNTVATGTRTGRVKRRPDFGHRRWVPQMARGITGTLPASPIRAAPRRPRWRGPSPSWPSGKIPARAPRPITPATSWRAAQSLPPRRMGICLIRRRPHPTTGRWKNSSAVRNRTVRPRLAGPSATTIGSITLTWLQARRAGPVRGMCSSPSNLSRNAARAQAPSVARPRRHHQSSSTLSTRSTGGRGVYARHRVGALERGR